MEAKDIKTSADLRAFLAERASAQVAPATPREGMARPIAPKPSPMSAAARLAAFRAHPRAPRPPGPPHARPTAGPVDRRDLATAPAPHDTPFPASLPGPGGITPPVLPATVLPAGKDGPDVAAPAPTAPTRSGEPPAMGHPTAPHGVAAAPSPPPPPGVIAPIQGTLPSSPTIQPHQLPKPLPPKPTN